MTISFSLLFACAAAVSPSPASSQLVPQSSGTDVRLQAVSAAGSEIVWASGLDGTFVRTTDGGRSWEPGRVAGAEELQFRDVHAVSADVAYLLSSGPGERSRIYRTADGGESWTLHFSNEEAEAFYDCFDFWDEVRGLAFSDSVRGRLLVLRTTNGKDWSLLASLPEALPEEGGFAASGTCLVTAGDATAYIGTGVAGARVLRTSDRGDTWSAHRVPIESGSETSGILALAFFDERNGVAAGGDLAAPDAHSDNVAITSDGGLSWRVGGRPTFPGAIYGLAAAPGDSTRKLIAVGPAGASLSTDGGESWSALSSESYWSVAFGDAGDAWMVGPEGRITSIVAGPP